MAALNCSRCGAHIQVDGTSSCSCVPIAARETGAAVFEAFRPRRKGASSRHNEDSMAGPAPDDNGRRRMGRPGRTVVVGLASTVVLGTAVFSVEAMSSGQAARGSRPAVSVSPDPDIAAREVMQGSDASSPDEPHTVSPSWTANGGTWHKGEDSGEHPGSRPPATHDEDPSPSPSGDAAGGSSQGGGSSDGGSSDGGSAGGGSAGGGSTGDPGEGDGGTSSAGGTQGSGGDGDESGGLLGGLFGGLLGGLFGGGDGGGDGGKDGGHDNAHGHDKGGDRDKGGARDKGGGHDKGGGRHH